MYDLGFTFRKLISFFFFFSWRKIALQCWVGFCCMTMQVSHIYIFYIYIHIYIYIYIFIYILYIYM